MCSSRLKRSFRIDDILARPRHGAQDKPENQTGSASQRIHSPTMTDNLRLPPLQMLEKCQQFPLVPTPLKPEVAWSADGLKPHGIDPRGYGFFHDPLSACEQAAVFRNSAIARRFTFPSIMSSPYGFDRAGMQGYWASCLGYLPGLAKRKGGQVRFTTQQTNTLEKRFAGNKYLSPEDRRTLAQQLKLSDRQVKTWFQNRRAKWRRTNSGDKSDAEVEETSDVDSTDDTNQSV